MDDVMQTRVASVLTAAVGVALLLSPLFVTVTGGALISTFIAGGLLVLAGVVQVFMENTIPSWVSGLTAVWIAISAAVFGMTGTFLWVTLAAAAAAFLLAMWDGVEVDQVAQKHHVHA